MATPKHVVALVSHKRMTEIALELRAGTVSTGIFVDLSSIIGFPYPLLIGACCVLERPDQSLLVKVIGAWPSRLCLLKRQYMAKLLHDQKGKLS